MADHNPDQDLSVEDLFLEALELPAAERSGYLRRAALQSPQLRAELDAMLRDYASMGDFLTESPLAQAIPATIPATAAGPAAAAGTVFGRYRIERSIGVGGMGEVYLAHDTMLNRTVALKLLPANTTDHSSALRFLNEARLASSLNHPNIVAIYDIARHRDTDFLVMEYVEGKSLKDLIPESGMTFEQLAGLGSQIALALGTAHAAGIVHRDIKPANIMVTTLQQVKVLDFGIAKHTRNDADMQLTGEGQIVGTVAYMSPEQMRGELIDFRSDIFSFGCLLYEAAAGHLPFHGATTWELMHQIATADPEPLGLHRPELPAQFVRLVNACLAKDRNQRPDSAIELATELKSLTFATQVLAAADVRPRRPTLAILPLKIRGAASDQFLSISLAEALVHRLSATGELTVRPMSAVMKYAREDADWPRTARELNVDLIVEGTIQVAGGRIRVLVQAHRVNDATTLASIKQDGDSSDLFALQDRLADTVSDVFVPRTSAPEPSVPPTRNSAAFELYLRAVALQARVDRFEISHSIDMLTRATELDPGFADAWGLLAQVYSQMGSHLDSDPKWFELGEQAIARTLELDPVQCTALCARSMILWSPSRAFQNRAALRALNAALRIDPARPMARHQRSAILWHLGFTEAAEEDALHLKATNPAPGLMHQGGCALVRGDFDRSAEFYRRALELEPNGVLNHLMAPVAILYAGRLDEARLAVAKARQMFPKESFGLGMEAILAALDGDARRAESLAHEALHSTQSVTHTHHTWHSCAAAYALAGQPDKALHELERCAAMGLPNRVFFQADPYLRPLHNNPRFQQLLTNLRREQDSIREEFGL